MPMLMPSASSTSTGHLRVLNGTQRIPDTRGSGDGDGRRHRWDLKRHSASDTSFEADERTGIICWKAGTAYHQKLVASRIAPDRLDSTRRANCPASRPPWVPNQLSRHWLQIGLAPA